MADQLPAKLRAWADESHPTWHGAPMVREAADTIDSQAAEIERLREALRGLRHAGALLSNIAFNLAQHPGRAISADEAADMGRCRKAWDEAARAALGQTGLDNAAGKAPAR